MQTQTSTLKKLKQLIAAGAIACVTPLLQASVESALEHGVTEQDYRDTRAVWAATRARLPDLSAGEVLAAEYRGFDADALHFDVPTEVIVTWLYDGAISRNSVGWYDYKTYRDINMIWRDGSSGPGAPLEQGTKASLGILPAGTDLRFFLREKGATGQTNTYYQDNEYNVDGHEQVAANFFYDDPSMPMVIGFEDRKNGGDEDFDDMMIYIEFRPVSAPTLESVDLASGDLSNLDVLPFAEDVATLAADTKLDQLLSIQFSGERFMQIAGEDGSYYGSQRAYFEGQNLSALCFDEKANRFYGYDSVSGTIVSIEVDAGQTTLFHTPVAGALPVALVSDQGNKRLLASVVDNGNYKLMELDYSSGSVVETELFTLDRSLTSLAWQTADSLLGFDYDTGELVSLSLVDGTTAALQSTAYAGKDAVLTSTALNEALPVGYRSYSYVLNDSQGDTDTLFNKVIPGQQGISKDAKGAKAVAKTLKIKKKHETTEEHHYLDASAKKITLQVNADNSDFEYVFGAYDLEVVEGLEPGSLEYAAAALSNGLIQYENGSMVWADGSAGDPSEDANKLKNILIDDRDHDVGAKVKVKFHKNGLAGKHIGYFLLPNAQLSDFFANPTAFSDNGGGDDTLRLPLFSDPDANPNAVDQVLTFKKGKNTYLFWEDRTRIYGDDGHASYKSFDDLVIRVNKKFLAVTESEAWLLAPGAEEDETVVTQSSAAPNGYDFNSIDLDNLDPIDLNTTPLAQDSYLHLTVLGGDITTIYRLLFHDLSRVDETLMLYPNLSRSAHNAIGGNHQHLGIGVLPEGQLLHFGWKLRTGATETYYTDTHPELVEAGMIPGTDIRVIKVSMPDGTHVATFAVTVEPWELEWSSDVRNLLLEE